MNESKNRFNERVSLMCAHKWIDNKQVFPMGMMTKNKGQLLGIKRMDKKEK
jgi:hypothetical protein